MVLDPNLIFYSCIAKETTVVAEFNAKDHHDLGSLALKCLAKTPPFHSTFSHTIRGKTYMFLIQDPFSYFAISDEKLENPDLLAFLKSVKVAFADVGDVGGDSWSKRKLDSLGSHCFQGEFNPVFHQLLSVSIHLEGPNDQRMGMKYVPERNSSMDSTKFGKVPLLSGHGGMTLKKKKKKKNMRFMDDLFGNVNGGKERKVDVCDEDDSGLNNQSSSNNQSCLLASVDSVMFQRHAKKSWQKHVYIVLSLDLIICLILFIVWLWVCRGFKCIDG